MFSKSRCGECSVTLGGCCTTDPNRRDLQYPISTTDVFKMADFLDVPISEIAEMFSVSSDEKFYLCGISKVFQPFLEGDVKLVLRIKPDGKCVMLGDDGCRLPACVRPTICRLYPLAPKSLLSNELSADLSNEYHCLAIKESNNISEILDSIGQTRYEANTLVDELRQSAITHRSDMLTNPGQVLKYQLLCVSKDKDLPEKREVTVPYGCKITE